MRHLSGDPVEVLPVVAAEEDVVALVIGARAHPVAVVRPDMWPWRWPG